MPEAQLQFQDDGKKLTITMKSRPRVIAAGFILLFIFMWTVLVPLDLIGDLFAPESAWWSLLLQFLAWGAGELVCLGVMIYIILAREVITAAAEEIAIQSSIIGKPRRFPVPAVSRLGLTEGGFSADPKEKLAGMLKKSLWLDYQDRRIFFGIFLSPEQASEVLVRIRERTGIKSDK